MKKINFIFGVHNHQPVGNFDNVFEMAVNRAYMPFLDVIERHPNIKIVFHYTGCLIDYLEENRPEILARLKVLVKRGQAEILTGGYYEPILSVIPDADKSGQIKKFSEYIKEKFSYNPKGMWLAERIWEPSLAKTLNEASVDYVVLDDTHFLVSGIEEKKLRGYFVTEEQGVVLKIFPISQHLRYKIPFACPEETIEYLRSEASDDPSQLLVIADDGEKFGIWPDTYKTCYEEGWLERFLTLLDKNAEWLNVTTFSEYTEKFSAKDRIYLPTASYFEMSEWTLSATSQVDFEEIVSHADANVKRFLKGGFWRNFLTKYSESNQMHKKMLYVSEKIQRISELADKQISERSLTSLTRLPAYPLTCLYKAQCNCAYWHGVFGGLYLPHLRHAIYKNLIEAENLIETSYVSESSSLVPSPVSRLPFSEVLDFDKDGQDEIILLNNNFNVCVKPSYGGSITEIDFKQVGHNLTDVLTRRFESYHKHVNTAVLKGECKKPETIHGVYYTKELDLKKYLKYDWYNRHSLIDHFFHPETTLEKFANCEYGELGDFVNQPYKWEVGSGKREAEIVLTRDGHLWADVGPVPVRIVKSIILDNDTIIVKYKITNNLLEEKEVWFGSEFNLSFSNPDDENCFYEATNRKEKFNATVSFENTNLLKISDKHFKFNINFTSSNLVDFWVFPIWTVSLSESGFEKTYQGSSVMPNKKIVLKPEEAYSLEIKISATMQGIEKRGW